MIKLWDNVFWVPNNQMKNTFCPARFVNAKNITASLFWFYSLCFLFRMKQDILFFNRFFEALVITEVSFTCFRQYDLVLTCLLSPGVEPQAAYR